MNTVCVMNQAIELKEWNGQRVVTFSDVDKVHKRPSGTASRNFKQNRKRFVEKEDFFLLLPNGRNSSIKNIPPKGITLLTEMGYLMLVKSFTDDLAWQVQRALVQSYFRVGESVPAPQLAPSHDCYLSVPVRKTFHNFPVMTSHDIAYFLGKKRNNLSHYMQRINIKGVLLTGEDLAHFKAENPAGTSLNWGSITIYDRVVTEAILRAYEVYEVNEAFFKDYFRLEGHASMSYEEMALAVRQAQVLLSVAKIIENRATKERALCVITELLMNIGLWNEKNMGYCGVSADWDVNSDEGWNKRTVLNHASLDYKLD